jgi:hypothetical protein
MSSFASPVEVFNAALVRSGADTITQNDGSREWTLFQTNYEPTVRSWMTKHRWAFALQEVTLVRSEDRGAGHYRYGYQIPADCLTPHEAWSDKCKVDYKIVGTQIRADLDLGDIVLTYTARKTEGYWPADFSEGIIYLMKSVIHSGLYEDSAGAREAMDMAVTLMDRAMIREKNAQARLPNSRDPVLVRAWRGDRHASGA